MSEDYTMPPRDRFTIAEAARYLGVKRQYLWNAVGHKGGPARNVDQGKVYYTKADLDAWRRARELPDNSYDVTAAAKYLKVKASYLNNLRHHKKGPAFERRGRKIRYTQAALDAWLKARSDKNEARAKKLLARAGALAAAARTLTRQAEILRRRAS